MSHTERAIGDLYGLPLDRFTKARNELAAELKTSGDDEGAAQVKRLQKPTVAAWAVNQLARRSSSDVAELLDVQSALADAGSAKKVRELSEKRRDLVAQLVATAEDVLRNEGHAAGSEVLQKVSRTLLAGTTGDEAELLRSGRLTRELSSSGFDQVFGFDASDDDEDADEEVDERARRKAQELEAEADAVDQQAAELERTVQKLRAELDDAEAAAATARRRAERARSKADAAWEKLG